MVELSVISGIAAMALCAWSIWYGRCVNVAADERDAMRRSIHPAARARLHPQVSEDVTLSRHAWAVATFRSRAALYSSPYLQAVAREAGIP